MAGEAEAPGSGCGTGMEGGAAGRDAAPGGEGSAAPDAVDSPPPGSPEERACRICYSAFDLGRHAPCLLSCPHAFCLQCLSQLQRPPGPGEGGEAVSITCPLCRRLTVLPDGLLLSLAAPGEAASQLPPQYRLRPLLPPRAVQQRPLPAQSGPRTTPSAEAGCGQWKPRDLLGGRRWLLACFLLVVLLSAAGGLGLHSLGFSPAYILLTASVFFLAVAWCFKGATEMTAREALLRSPEAAACQSLDSAGCTRAGGEGDC